MNWLQVTELSAVALAATIACGFYVKYLEAVKNLRLTLEASSDIVFLIDSNSRYIDVFAGRESILLATRKTLIGRHVTEVIGPDLGMQVEQLVKQTFASGLRQTLAYSLDLPTGEKRHFEAGIERRDSRSAVAMIRSRGAYATEELARRIKCWSTRSTRVRVFCPARRHS
ncbi:MAG: hypothetical protein EOP09_15055, partial [Proteobacteria bacterium]